MRCWSGDKWELSSAEKTGRAGREKQGAASCRVETGRESNSGEQSTHLSLRSEAVSLVDEVERVRSKGNSSPSTSA